jgi:CRP-like cAMP-binding protein
MRAMSAQILEKVEIFADLNADQLRQIYSICKEMVFFQGELIFAEGTPSSEFYVILEGEVSIEVDPILITDKKADLPRGIIALLFSGQSFGEVALVDQGLRSASAVCNSMVCKTLMIQRSDLMDLLHNDPQMGFIVMNNLAADLCVKIRLSNLNLRQNLLYAPAQAD